MRSSRLISILTAGVLALTCGCSLLPRKEAEKPREFFGMDPFYMHPETATPMKNMETLRKRVHTLAGQTGELPDEILIVDYVRADMLGERDHYISKKEAGKYTNARLIEYEDSCLAAYKDPLPKQTE